VYALASPRSWMTEKPLLWPATVSALRDRMN
jgi:hypothetical protein